MLPHTCSSELRWGSLSEDGVSAAYDWMVLRYRPPKGIYLERAAATLQWQVWWISVYHEPSVLSAFPAFMLAFHHCSGRVSAKCESGRLALFHWGVCRSLSSRGQLVVVIGGPRSSSGSGARVRSCYPVSACLMTFPHLI